MPNISVSNVLSNEVGGGERQMGDTNMARVVSRRESSTCTLPRNLLTRAGWRTGEIVTFSFGSAKRRIRVQGGEDDAWQLPSSLIRALGMMPRRWSYHLDKESRVIRFGPLIGIMTTWQMTPYFRSVMRAAASRGMMAVVFRPHSLRPGVRHLDGWGLVNGMVRQVRVPWPDVVYNRIPNRGGELLRSTRNCKRWLEQARIPVFNRRFFHKWRIHRLLRRDEKALRYLPETQPMLNLQQVRHFLSRYPSAYLKPNGGSKGQGIVRVIWRRGQGYQVSFRKGNRNYQHVVGSWPQAASMIRRAMSPRSYVIQEGITLANYRGRPFDIRVTLYKNGQREWIPCGSAAKIAGYGSITTHVANGGRVIPLSRALRHVFGNQAEEVRERIEAAAVDLALAVERVTALELGEIGLDIGLTAQGRVTMFEANSKPGRAVFAAAWNRQDRWKSLLYLCDYATSLAGFDRGVS